jgi:peptidoglycan/xylan/chitin deacetylase (PgdA/CDA1 family)
MSRPATEPQRRCALTFDDGPEAQYTPRILDVLATHEVPATFFCLGRQVNAHPDLVHRIHTEGHLLANHTFTHPDLTTLSPHDATEEIAHTGEVLARITGSAPRWFRPPYGAINSVVRRVAEALQVRVALWTIDSRDWTGLDGVGILEQVVPRLSGPWEVVLLHTGAHAPHTAESLPELIRQARRRGYDLVTLADAPDGQ